MSKLFRAASLAVTNLCAFAAAGGFSNGGALGATTPDFPVMVEPLPPVPAIVNAPDAGIAAPVEAPDAAVPEGAARSSLTSLVTGYVETATTERDLRCLATAVYFESKGEPLNGQLAVAHVILNRAQSGRFASTVCGVVLQPSQFSFVRGGALPVVPDNLQWRRALGVAHVALAHLVDNPAPGALFFHARRVSPNWGKQPVATLGNHIFYR